MYFIIPALCSIRAFLDPFIENVQEERATNPEGPWTYRFNYREPLTQVMEDSIYGAVKATPVVLASLAGYIGGQVTGSVAKLLD